MLAAALLGAVAAWCGTPAWAANASDLKVTLDGRPLDSVSLSRQNLPTYIAYRVTLANTGGNTINQVRLTGTTVADGSTAAAFNSVVVNAGITPTCGPAGAAVVTCTVGQMKAGNSSDFFLLFQTPTDGVHLNFELDTTFSEGNSPNSPPANITESPLTFNVLLTQPDGNVNTHVNTVILPAGGTFFTGPNGVVSSTNPFSSIVTLPAVTNLVTNNTIDLASVPSFQCGNSISYFCFGLSSSINVDNAKDDSKVFYPAGQIITIILRQDASSLSTKHPIPKVGDVQIFYNPNDPQFPGDVGALVPACTGNLPQPNQPCVSGRTDNLKGNKGYYEYQIRAVDNGHLSW
jgi:hypothetical protein